MDAPKLKRRRITQACDYCHQRSIRCQTSGNGQNCQNCKEFAQACTYNRKPRRRGAKPRSAGVATVVPAEPTPTPSRPNRVNGNGSSTQLSASLAAIPSYHRSSASWRAPEIASQANIMDLVELYFEIVYPIFPFFHYPSFVRSIARAEYTTRRPLYATTMAVCALVSSRVRDGAMSNPKWDLQALLETDPDIFYAEAKQQLVELVESDFNVVRAHAVLAIAAIQNGRIRDMHQHLGTYHTFVAMDGLHDETNWPRNIGIIEREERRRLFWSIYTLDIYTAAVWGGIIRCREKQSNVAYPSEVDDEFIDDNGITRPTLEPSGISPSFSRNRSGVQPDCWMCGWNFITDLYRVLEHALTRFRGHRCRLRQSSLLREIFEDEPSITEASIRDNVLQMYINLPECFKETPEMTYNIKKDRFRFQAANITGSIQLLRIVLFAAGGASIQERCQIASDVVDAFMSIPVSYLRAISTPLLHHLGGIGAIMGSVFEEPLSESDYNRVRSVLLSMAQLLESLEVIHRRASASENLRAQVSRIDEYMATQRQVSPIQEEPPAEAVPLRFTLEGEAPPPPETFEQLDPTNPGSWVFQVPANLLDELTWNFDFV